MHSFLGLIVRGVLAVYLLQQVHKTWWKHYFWITFVEHCISISWKLENWSALILDWSRLFVTWTSGFVHANLLWREQYVHANFGLCTWLLFFYFCGRLILSLSLERGAKFVPICCDANSMFTQISMTFFVTWTWGDVCANLLWREQYGHANFNYLVYHNQEMRLTLLLSHQPAIIWIIQRICQKDRKDRK